MVGLLAQSVDPGRPQIRRQAGVAQLTVDGRPFLILGGELHNSSASSLEYMRPIWPRLVAMHFNTVLAPLSWELVEPVEGRFDFALVDGLIADARRHGLRLVFLWFGSWKNGMSSYTPQWVKRDPRRFPRAAVGTTGEVEVLSTCGVASRQADARAFAALMRHIREVDGAEHTVLMMQVENEVGVLRDSRDRSAAATAAFNAAVPTALMAYLGAHRAEIVPGLRTRWERAGGKTSGSWAEVFGDSPQTDEMFMAWQYAGYVDAVAAAGKAEYDIPMYANAWLNESGGPGDYPSGGPLPHVMDLWLAAAPHLDLLAPDIYAADFQAWARRYVQRGNVLFVPEMRREAEGARHVFFALGETRAIGTAPFAVDSMENPAESPLAESYAVLRQMAPTILAHQASGEMIGFELDRDHPSVTKQLGTYSLEISLDEAFGHRADVGYGLIALTSPTELVGAGRGFQVVIGPKAAGAPRVYIAGIDEGTFTDGRWVAGRRLNGDESDQNHKWRFAPGTPSISRCVVYAFD
jgi:beta-galactosidase GanA